MPWTCALVGGFARRALFSTTPPARRVIAGKSPNAHGGLCATPNAQRPTPNALKTKSANTCVQCQQKMQTLAARAARCKPRRHAAPRRREIAGATPNALNHPTPLLLDPVAHGKSSITGVTLPSPRRKSSKVAAPRRRLLPAASMGPRLLHRGWPCRSISTRKRGDRR